jgi:hypothetical protein
MAGLTFMEHRKHKRFKARDWIFTVFQSSVRLGQILDIGLGGFSFFYAPPEIGYVRNGAHSVDIFDTKAGNRLERVQCRVIYDYREKSSRGQADSEMRRCGAQFVELSHSQLSQLLLIIQTNTECPE